MSYFSDYYNHLNLLSFAQENENVQVHVAQREEIHASGIVIAKSPIYTPEVTHYICKRCDCGGMIETRSENNKPICWFCEQEVG